MQALMFHKCNNLVVKNLIIMNGQQCQMTFTTCDGVKASRLSISAPASSPNTDGIHISESTNVEVKDAAVRTGFFLFTRCYISNMFIYKLGLST